MDTNAKSDSTTQLNINHLKNGDESNEYSGQVLSTSKTNANVLFAQKNVKLTYSQPYLSNQHISDSDLSTVSSTGKETQSAISEADQHILDLTDTGLESARNGIMDSENYSSEKSVFNGTDNSLLESIPPPMEFSDDHISPEESEASTLTDPGDLNVPVTNLDDLLGGDFSDSTATSTPVHISSVNHGKHFPENDDVLVVESSTTDDEQSMLESFNKILNNNSIVSNSDQNIPCTVIDNIEIELSDVKKKHSTESNLLNFDTQVANVIEGGKPTTLFDIGVKAVTNVQQIYDSANIDPSLSSVQTDIPQTSLKSSCVEINNHDLSVSPGGSDVNTKQIDEMPSNQTSHHDDNVTSVQIGLISLDPDNIVDEGLVTRVPLVDVNDNEDIKLENQLTNIAVNEPLKVTKFDVGYQHCNSSNKQENNNKKLPGSLIFSVDGDIKETNTARITVDNNSINTLPEHPIPSPRLSQKVIPHIPKPEPRSQKIENETFIKTSENSDVEFSPQPVPRKARQNSPTTSNQPSSPSLNKAMLVDAVQPNATILVNSVQQDFSKPIEILLDSKPIETLSDFQPIETLLDSKPTLVYNSNNDRTDSIINNEEPKSVASVEKQSTITIKTSRPKSSKSERSDRSDRIMLTTYQPSEVNLSRNVEEEESIEPITFVQDEQGNRSCVPTPPRTPKKQLKLKDESANKELTDILLQLVNLGPGANTIKNVSDPNSIVKEELIECQKVSRETIATVLDAFSKLIPNLDNNKPQKSIFQKAVSEVIEVDNNNVKGVQNVPSHGDIKSPSSDSIVASKRSVEVIVSQPAPVVLSEQVKSSTVTTTEDLKYIFSEIESSKPQIVDQESINVTESQSIKKTNPIDQNRQIISQTNTISEKPLDKNKMAIHSITEAMPMIERQQISAKKPTGLNLQSTMMSTAPKKLSTSPHITTIRTQPNLTSYSSIKTSLTSFSSKAPKADYPKNRCEDRPFQVDVLKGIAGLGIKLTVGKDGLAKVTNIQTSGPVAKNGQMRVGDYVLSINSTVLNGQTDSKVQQILRLLPRGLSKLVISIQPPDALTDKTVPLTIDTNTNLDNNMELSPSSPASGFTKYGVRLSPKPFSSLSNSLSPTTAKSFAEGLAGIKESTGKYSPVTAPTFRKVSVDKTPEVTNGATVVDFPFDKQAPATNSSASVPFPFSESSNSDETQVSDSVAKTNNVTEFSAPQNGIVDEIVVKTDNSSVESTPTLSPRSADEVDYVPEPVAEKRKAVSTKQEPVKVHATQIYVNRDQNLASKNLGIDIPKAYAESKIIAATWGKDTSDPTPQLVKSPPPVAPKPKSRSAKSVPEQPKQEEIPAPVPTLRQKSPGAETLNLTDKLKKFETEIQRQSDSAKPAPIASRRTSSSSEHSVASSQRSTSPDRDVFLQEEKKGPEIKSRSNNQSQPEKHGPQMVYSTTVTPKGDLPMDQNHAYSMKISSNENSMEITRTEVKKQSADLPGVPKRRTSSSSSSNASPLSPSSPFFQNPNEKPAKINPVRLNRALAPKGSPPNQNVEIKSTVKLTAPSHIPSDPKEKGAKSASWFAGKESSQSTANIECTSPPPNVVSTQPRLVYQSPNKSPQNVSTTNKSPKDSMKAPEHVSSTKADLDDLISIQNVRVNCVSPRSEETRKPSIEEMENKFHDLLDLPSSPAPVSQNDTVGNNVKLDNAEKDTEETPASLLMTSLNHEEINAETTNIVESAPMKPVTDQTAEGSLGDIPASNVEDIVVSVDGQVVIPKTEDEDLKSKQDPPVDETTEQQEDVETEVYMLSESAVEPFAAALVERVIEGAKESIMTLSNDNLKSEDVNSKQDNDKQMDMVASNEDEMDAEIIESFAQQSVEVVHSKPDLINDVDMETDELKMQTVIPNSASDYDRTPSPPPLPSSPPPPLPSSPPPISSIPPPMSMMSSIEDPPDLVDFLSGDVTLFTKPEKLSKPDVVSTSEKPLMQEEEIEIENVENVSACPNIIRDMTPSSLPDVTPDNQSAINGTFSHDSCAVSDVDIIIADNVGSSVDPIITSMSESTLNTACDTQHDDNTTIITTVISASNTMLADEASSSPENLTSEQTSTDINVVKAVENNLLDSNENLFSAKPVVISAGNSQTSQISEPDLSNITNSSSLQVSSFQESLPKTDGNHSDSHIYSSTPAKKPGTLQMAAKEIDIDSSFKSNLSSNETILDTSEYVNISMTSNGPDITNEALKVNSCSKRDWTFLSSDKNNSDIEGKANISFEFLDFSNISLIEPDELKRLVDLANQTMDRTGVSPSDQIVVALLHRNQPTDKVGMELLKGSYGKIIVFRLTEGCLANSDGKVHINDCLLSVNGKSVEERSVQDIQDTIETPCSSVVLVLSRGDHFKKTELASPTKEKESMKTATTPITPTTPTFAYNSADYETSDAREVTMTKGATGVGFCLAGGLGSPQGDMPIIIKRIFKGGPAEKCGQLQVKDQILKVNDLDFTTMRHYEAWNHLKYLPDGDIKFVIRRSMETYL